MNTLLFLLVKTPKTRTNGSLRPSLRDGSNTENRDKTRRDYNTTLQLKRRRKHARMQKHAQKLNELNEELRQLGLDPLQDQEYDAFIADMTKWLRKNPSSSRGDYLEYYKKYTEAKAEWLTQNVGSDYDAHIKALEIQRQKKDAWEAKHRKVVRRTP